MPLMRRLSPSLLAAMALVALGTGCARLSNTMSDGLTSVITPYRVEIVQGNVVTREQAALVKPGQTRSQVRDLIGSPLLADPFHTQRWDYVFVIRRPGTEPQQRIVTVWFEGDKVSKLDAPADLPGERYFVASIPRPRPGAMEPKRALTVAELAALPAPVRAAAASEAGPLGAVRSYPPLEAR